MLCTLSLVHGHINVVLLLAMAAFVRLRCQLLLLRTKYFVTSPFHVHIRINTEYSICQGYINGLVHLTYLDVWDTDYCWVFPTAMSKDSLKNPEGPFLLARFLAYRPILDRVRSN